MLPAQPQQIWLAIDEFQKREFDKRLHNPERKTDEEPIPDLYTKRMD